MSAYAYSMRVRFVGLPCWKPAFRFGWWLWSPPYIVLGFLLQGKPGIRGWFWSLLHNRQWQKSSTISGVTWVLGTFIVFNLVERLGYGWEINIGVSLALDVVVYAVHKRWVFNRRKITIRVSYGRNMTISSVFFGLNFFLSWLVLHRLGFGTLYGRSILGCYGIVVNPLMFFIRDKGIFSQLSLKELLITGLQALRKTEIE